MSVIICRPNRTPSLLNCLVRLKGCRITKHRGPALAARVVPVAPSPVAHLALLLIMSHLLLLVMIMVPPLFLPLLVMLPLLLVLSLLLPLLLMISPLLTIT